VYEARAVIEGVFVNVFLAGTHRGLPTELIEGNMLTGKNRSSVQINKCVIIVCIMTLLL